ncbi:MAG: SDR family NAD(P)-dependent oxidoreductase, partial [Myxococcales bacterium]|nr:SDR family NAD(P)-dependent oxidoreductase [Myxococcales bacterium]
RSEDKLAALLDEHGPERVATVPVDLTRPETLAEAHAEAEAAFGPVDVLLNNAGRSQRARALETTMEEVRALMELNFMAPVALTRLAAPGMITRGRGVIVIVGSLAGYIATPLRSTYNASKFAVRGWFDALRAELHDTGVEVCVVIPGYVQTNIARAAVAGQGRTHGVADAGVEQGISAARCAAKIVTAIE